MLHGGTGGAEVRPVAINFQPVIDRTNPERLADPEGNEFDIN